MRKLKVPGLKGRWESTLGRWAGKSLPYVQVVLALWELWSGYQEDEGARDKVRQQVMQTNRAVDELRVNLKRSLDEQLDCWMSQIDGELNNLFNATASGVKDEIDALIGKQAGLNGIRERLDRLSA